MVYASYVLVRDVLMLVRDLLMRTWRPQAGVPYLPSFELF